MHKFKFLLVFVALAAFSIAAVGCGSSDSDEPVSDSVIESDVDPIQITLPEGVFSADDVAAAGWKKSKELSPETLPGATSVWYGFYQQRDVEVRVYESQDEAIGSGQELADLATGRRKPNTMIDTGTTNAQTTTRTSYLSYAIVGNLILLCEVKIEDCQSLLDGIGQ